MFDRSGRSTWRQSDSAPPGAYSPVLPSKPVRPSAAPFSTGASRALSARPTKLPKEPAPIQYLSHEPIKLKGASQAPQSFMTTASRFSANQPRTLQVRIKDGRVLVAPAKIKDVPGPGAYDVPVAVMEHPSGHKFSLAERPTTAPAVSKTSDDALNMSWTNVRKNPPSIPCTTDYGYDFTEEGTLVPQPPPPERMPRSPAPGPTSYNPDDRATTSHSRKGSFVAFSSSKSRRVDLSDNGTKRNPGPGQYEADAKHILPSAKLQSSSFASNSRKGMDAIVVRTATGSRVGPGTHFDDRVTSGFRPHTASKAPVHHFGTTQTRFPDVHPAYRTPGPGTYSATSSAEQVSTAARQQALLLERIASRRTRYEIARRVSNSPGRDMEGHTSAKPESKSTSPVRDVPPVPVFYSSAPRFSSDGSRAELPGVGTYNLTSIPSSTSIGGQRASSAPPGARRVSFGIGADRFNKNSLGRPSMTSETVGPGTYVQDDERRTQQTKRPSAAFLTKGDRALPGPDRNIGDTGFLAQNLRKDLGTRGAAVSAQLGKFDALAPRRLVDKLSDVPGPGTYTVSKPQVDVVALKERYATQRPSLSKLATGSAAPAVMISASPRFRGDNRVVPGPGQYEPDTALGGRTKRTFNVTLAANEARAIIHKSHIPTVGKMLQTQ